MKNSREERGAVYDEQISQKGRRKALQWMAGYALTGAMVGLACSSPASVDGISVQPSTAPHPLDLSSEAKHASKPEVVATEEKIQQEVRRLALSYKPEITLVRKIYLGEQHPDISPIFNMPPKVGLISESDSSIGGMVITSASVNENKLFIEEEKNRPSPVIEKMDVAINFSSAWLNFTTDRAKQLIMSKEASHLLIFEGISNSLFQARKPKIRSMGEGVTEDEMRQSIAFEVFGSSPVMNKLLDYSAFLLFLSGFEDLLALQGEEFVHDMKKTLFPKLLKMAQERGIPYREAVKDPKLFYQLAFGEGSAWADMIADRALPPAPIIVYIKAPIQTPFSIGGKDFVIRPSR